MTSKIRIIIFWVLTLLLGTFGVGRTQTARQDSLLKLLGQNNVLGIDKVALLVHVSESYYLSDPATGMKYANQALELSKNINDRKYEGNALRLIGLCLYMQSHYSQASSNMRAAYQIDSLRGDQAGMAASLANLALVQTAQSNFPLALANYQRAHTLFEKLGNLRFASTVSMNMGIIYSEQENYSKALAYMGAALASFRNMGQQANIANCLTNMGVIASKQNQNQKALAFFRQALEINEKEGIKSGVARDNGNVGSMLSRSEQYQQAIPYLLKALELYEQIDNKKGIATNLQSLGETYMKLNADAKAMESTKKSYELGRQTGLLEVQKESAKNLVELFERLGKTDSALAYYRHYVSMRDSIDNQQRRKQITRLELQYEFDKKESDYIQQQALSQAKVREQELTLAVNNEQLARSRQEQKLQQLAYLKTQNELQKEQLARETQERLKEIAERQRNEQATKVKVLSQETELIKLRNKQQILYASLGFALVLTVFVLVVYGARVRQFQLKGELQKQQSERMARELIHERQLLESELKSIRSQMNPHFIFNVLNSIESYILVSDPKKASRLVQKFAALSRLILENSTQSLVPVDREWKVLQLYLELEAERFQNQFMYDFEVDSELPLHQMLIPPMLVQPLLENAVLHGLRPYSGNDGFLNVRLTQVESQISFMVTDNGVGLNGSKQGAASPSTKQQSLALKTIKDRINILNQVSESLVAKFELTDRRQYGERGTVAVLTLPFRINQQE